ncbi:hypothetical protein OYC64_007372 [Pagothenia borchgrevinki]|uniref:Uncharacterized protein n=1 Tax=Pagothenia borchgrevinki TaxID=8213 RepID=A0ABD2GSW4_PAGBO
MKVVSLATQVHPDVLIVMMNEKGDKDKVMKLEEMKSKMDEHKQFKSLLRFWYCKTAEFGKAAVENFRQKTGV